MERKKRGELVATPQPFDYSLVAADLADRVRSSAERIREKVKRTVESPPSHKLASRLTMLLERYKQRWDQQDLPELARQLREFADELENPPRGAKRARRE